MRVSPIKRNFGAFCVAGAALMPTHALGQTTIAPLLAADDPEYKIDPLSAGPINLQPRVIVTANYDDNVIASPDGAEVEDLEFIVRPELEASIGDTNMRFTLAGFGEFSRFSDFTTEDSDIYGVSGDFSYSPSLGDRLNMNAGYARLKENRGDPEARDLAIVGPRLVDDTFANISYRREGGRLLLGVEAAFSDLDAVSPLDDDRDFKTYSGRATVGYRVSGPIYATLTGFASVRDFRLEGTPILPDRDATTYGGQIGLSFIDSERLRGRARVGAFRFDPNDPGIEARTGFSVDASIAYLPTRRSALILEAFRGDVATFRRGAQARTDTRLALTGQFELRHNLYARTGLRWIQSRFIGSGIEEKIYGSNLGLEYLASRNVSLIAEANASERVSDDRTQEFDRLRASLSVRIRF